MKLCNKSIGTSWMRMSFTPVCRSSILWKRRSANSARLKWGRKSVPLDGFVVTTAGATMLKTQIGVPFKPRSVVSSRPLTKTVFFSFRPIRAASYHFISSKNFNWNAPGISLPRISVTGQQLPTARYVSAFIHRDLGYHDHAVTVFLPAFGQLIDHDMASVADTKGV